MYPISSEDLNRETEEEIYFFTPAFHVFDNFSAHRIEMWGEYFPTAEHAYHWKKFAELHLEIAKDILNAESPDVAQKIAHEHNKLLPVDWHQKKTLYMKEILETKVSQHKDVREILLKTGTKTIIENSPNDSFWGSGREGNGENMVGKILMGIRSRL